MKIHCPDCGAIIVSADINLTSGLAKCRACNAAFSITPALHQDARRRVAAAPAEPAAGRPILSRPNYMRVEERGLVWRVRWRWFGAKHVGMLFFCIAWDSFLVFWYSMAFSDKAPWVMAVFPIAHLAAGIGITYSTLAGLLNTTVLEVTPDRVRVRHRPVPWRGNCDVIATDIAQIHCEQISRTGRNQQTTMYDMCATLRDGSRLKLIRGLETADDARYLEGEIERRLNIEPRAVAGEYNPQR